MYRLILFDVDGVFLSEERCFDASALSVWELLYAPHFLHLHEGKYSTTPSEEQIRHIRKLVFQEDKVLDWMKDRGINANWDMVYLVFTAFVKEWLASPITEKKLLELKPYVQGYTPNFSAFFTVFDEKKEKLDRDTLLIYFNYYVQTTFGVEVDYFSRVSELWELGRSIYQEWYFGEELYRQEEGFARTKGKQGFLTQEIPLAPLSDLRQLLADLQAHGVTLGIGTGRPWLEMEVPLREMGLLPYFAQERVITASDVVRAEIKYPEAAPLGKPHPYSYLLGYLGNRDADGTNYPLPIADGEEVLIVGDSVADLLAARKLGCHFAATLTGLTGHAAREKFEELGADYIFNDVRELRTLME
jgi:phosphoglycolate phosphatase-like HAD superfamily hydrolase